jgi:hypothetical protein
MNYLFSTQLLFTELQTILVHISINHDIVTRNDTWKVELSFLSYPPLAYLSRPTHSTLLPKVTKIVVLDVTSEQSLQNATLTTNF